jgi:hypothetical protein
MAKIIILIMMVVNGFLSGGICIKIGTGSHFVNRNRVLFCEVGSGSYSVNRIVCPISKFGQPLKIH